MFCSKCGKEIAEDANFCVQCGAKQNGVQKNRNYSGAIEYVDRLLDKYGAGKVLRYASIILAAFGLLIRIICNETITVYNFLAQDDYFAASGMGKGLLLLTCIATILVSWFVYSYSKKTNRNVENKDLIAPAITIAIAVILILIRIPAPW